MITLRRKKLLQNRDLPHVEPLEVALEPLRKKTVPRYKQKKKKKSGDWMPKESVLNSEFTQKQREARERYKKNQKAKEKAKRFGNSVPRLRKDTNE